MSRDARSRRLSLPFTRHAPTEQRLACALVPERHVPARVPVDGEGVFRGDPVTVLLASAFPHLLDPIVGYEVEFYPLADLQLLAALPAHEGDEILLDLALEVAQPIPETHTRSEEHTSELQSRQYLVCRLLL